jgi:hypothetical protein
MIEWSTQLVRHTLRQHWPELEAPFLEQEFKNSTSKITLICPTHGKIIHRAENIVRLKCGCKKCSLGKTNEALHKKRLSDFKGSEIFLNSLPPKHPEKLYFRIEKAEVICPVHGTIEMPIKSLLRGYGCRKCSYAQKGVNSRDSWEEYKERLTLKYSSKYSYEIIGEFVGAQTRLLATCPKHGAWEVSINNHLGNNTECPTCAGVVSKGSVSLFEFISSLDPSAITEHRLPNKTRLDIFLPEKKIGIEYNGVYYHSHKFVSNNHHIIRRKYCESLGIRLVTIWEDEWPNTKTEAYLRNLLGLSQSIFARKCRVALVRSEKAREFYEHNHLMGPGITSNLNVGLYLGGELVACSSFRKVFKNFELYRAAYLSGYRVIGGLSKMVKHLLSKSHFYYHQEDIVSYVDLDKFDGRSYAHAGFVPVRESVSMSYSHKGQRYSRHTFKKENLVGEGTEKQIMESRGYYQCFNSGTLKVVLASSRDRK